MSSSYANNRIMIIDIIAGKFREFYKITWLLKYLSCLWSFWHYISNNCKVYIFVYNDVRCVFLLVFPALVLFQQTIDDIKPHKPINEQSPWKKKSCICNWKCYQTKSFYRKVIKYILRTKNDLCKYWHESLQCPHLEQNKIQEL